MFDFFVHYEAGFTFLCVAKTVLPRPRAGPRSRPEGRVCRFRPSRLLSLCSFALFSLSSHPISAATTFEWFLMSVCVHVKLCFSFPRLPWLHLSLCFYLKLRTALSISKNMLRLWFPAVLNLRLLWEALTPWPSKLIRLTSTTCSVTFKSPHTLLLC